MGCLLTSNVNVFSKTELVIMKDRKILKQVLIANGAYGQVWKCKQVNTNIMYALKTIKIQNKELQQMYQKEVRVLKKMRQINSKGIVKLVEDCKTSYKDNQRYELGQLLLQFGHISLFDQIINKRFSSKQIARILIQILEGVKQLHSQNIFHLDLKPENIVLIGNRYKICDLGSCIQGSVDFKTISKPYRTIIQEFIQSNSTLIYRSPQMIDTTNKIIDGKSDIWMVGLIGFFMLYRKQPFQGQGKLAIISPLQFPTLGQLQDILKSFLKINPQERSSIQQSMRKLHALS